MTTSDLPLSSPLERQWKLQVLLLCHLIAAFLIFTLFSPLTQKYWEVIDIAFFKAINGTLEGRPLWQHFWAFANHKYADWVEDLCVLAFFITYVRQAGKGFRARRIANLLFAVIYIAAIIYFVNRILFREHLSIPRLSPTLVVDDSVRLSNEIPWLSIKDDSSKSFPGDHGTTALLFGAIFSYLAGWRLGIFASLYAAFLCLPRLITGAHWLSDVIVGSGSITLLCLSWVYCTPFAERISACFEKCLKCFSSKSV
jgi:membrane-associated phospholipid phosphatase